MNNLMEKSKSKESQKNLPNKVLQNFSDYMSEKIIALFYERIVDVKSIAALDEEYSELSNKINVLYDRIESYLPKDEPLLSELEELFSRQESIADEFIYTQGFRDGLNSKKE